MKRMTRIVNWPRVVNSRNRYKVLSVTDEITNRVWAEDFPKHSFLRIAPVFKRDGFYYDRDLQTAWFEFDNGNQAFVCLPDHFLFQLEMLNVRRLSIEEMDAIELLMRNRFDLSEQLVYLYYNNVMIRDMRNFERQLILLRQKQNVTSVSRWMPN